MKIQFYKRELKNNKLMLSSIDYDYLVSIKKHNKKVFEQLLKTLKRIDENTKPLNFIEKMFLFS